MSRWRLVILAVLFVLPIAFLASVGGYALYRSGWAFYTWWPMAACFALAYVLAWYWHRHRTLVPEPDAARGHWTERDKAAWELVRKRAQQVKNLQVDKLAEPGTYLDAARTMADELARHYHPKASDPFSRVTVPELLTVVELATHDLSKLVDDYLPGGHLMTIGDWRRASKAVDWYKRSRTAYWLVSALFDPISTGVRYAASQAGISQPLDALQQDLTDWLFVAYLNRLGAYLIELYSGRLKVGAERYRDLTAASATVPVTLALFGQVKAGKSSLVNALTTAQLADGPTQRKAVVDALPATSSVNRYRAKSPDGAGELIVLDTVGYGHEGPKADDRKGTEAAAQEADALILVLHARTAARAADVAMLARLREFFANRPDLKRPPLIVVLTHADLLSPSLEWSPPYDWQNGSRPKEKSMVDAVAAALAALGDGIDAIVPVCVAEGRLWNVTEGLVPLLAARLDDARAAALVRALGVGGGGVGKVLAQLRSAGAMLLERLLR